MFMITEIQCSRSYVITFWEPLCGNHVVMIQFEFKIYTPEKASFMSFKVYVMQYLEH